MKRIFAIILAILTIIACKPALDDTAKPEEPGTENPGEDKPDPDDPEIPENTFVYQVVDVQPIDWSGDYLLMYKGANDFAVFNSYDGEKSGKSTCTLTLSDFVAEGIPSKTGDPMKSIIGKVGDNYSIYVSNVGYIGLDKNEKYLRVQADAPTSAEKGYLWSISLWDAQNGLCQIKNAAYPSKKLQWNDSANMFRCYDSGQKDLALYRRNVSNGEPGDGTGPENPGGGDIPDPDEPDPDPEEPGGEDPLPTDGKYGWYELPVMNTTTSGQYIIGSEDKNLYFAHHFCAGNETAPNKTKARNYTVCYSAEHHCPVWVAAPRHKMYETKNTDRTNAYGKDPKIPSDIQYNSTSTGGGCNKGHMLGSAERLSSSATNRQVFYYTNIAPQLSGTFNTGGGGWNILEDWVDEQVCSDTLYVVIGAYFDKYTDRRGYSDSPTTISFGGRNDVTRPTMFYYILLRTKKGNTGKPLSRCSASELQCAAFVRSHSTGKSIRVSEKDMMSVSELEKITGFKYFANVPQAPKDSYDASDWGL